MSKNESEQRMGALVDKGHGFLFEVIHMREWTVVVVPIVYECNKKHSNGFVHFR